MLLSTAYFPPVEWFRLTSCHAERSEASLLEACENYRKQSYRNRCYILAADGPQMLQVPVVHGASWAIQDVLVDYSTPWVLRTQRALDTAYETSAFYEYYRDEVFALLDARPATLWELNLTTIRWGFAALGLPFSLGFTSDFLPDAPDDYRFSLHPKKPAVLPERPYYQVFRDRLGRFTPGLSVMDLIFNEGPNALSTILP